MQCISRTGRDSPPTPRKSNGEKTVIEKKQAVKGFVMRTMVRAAQESKVRKGIGPDSGIGTGIAENLKGNGKVGIRNQ